MEATIAQLKTVKPVVSAPNETTPTKKPSEDALEGASRKTLVHSIVQGLTGVKGEAPSCPKCGSTQTTKEGSGKLRKDGTRAVRVRCKTCGKFSMIG